MTRWLPALVLPWLVLAGLVLAIPGAARAADPRLVTRAYRGDEVVQVEGKAGVQATIAFGAGEQIENVAVGDADKWQITPNKRADLLFVKPLAETARTNMTVVTDRHTYFFDLAASPAAKPVYMLRFSYAGTGDGAPGAAASGLAAPTAPAPMATGGAGPPSSPDPALLNFAWKRHGAPRLLPAQVYDDGTATYLLWTADQAVPAIMLRDADGTETPATFAVRGNTIVVAAAPAVVVLRSGHGEATLTNQRAVAAPPPATVTAPVVPPR